MKTISDLIEALMEHPLDTEVCGPGGEPVGIMYEEENPRSLAGLIVGHICQVCKKIHSGQDC